MNNEKKTTPAWGEKRQDRNPVFGTKKCLGFHLSPIYGIKFLVCRWQCIFNKTGSDEFQVRISSKFGNYEKVMYL